MAAKVNLASLQDEYQFRHQSAFVYMDDAKCGFRALGYRLLAIGTWSYVKLSRWDVVAGGR